MNYSMTFHEGSTDRALPYKRTWTPKEDAAILKLVGEHGASNWGLIAASLAARTGKQCRERYHNHLQPDVKKGDWTEAEDLMILELQRKYGNQWAKITKELPGRTDNAVKNRWHAAMRSQAKRAEAQQAKTSKAIVVPKLALGFSKELPSSSGALSARQVPPTIEEIVRKYSPRFENEMRLSDSVDLNLISHGHHMHTHDPVTARCENEWLEDSMWTATEKPQGGALASLMIAAASSSLVNDFAPVRLETSAAVKEADLAELATLMAVPAPEMPQLHRAPSVVSEEYLANWCNIEGHQVGSPLDDMGLSMDDWCGSDSETDSDEFERYCVPPVSARSRMLSPRMISPRVSHHSLRVEAKMGVKKRSRSGLSQPSAAASVDTMHKKLKVAETMPFEIDLFDNTIDFNEIDNIMCF